MLFELTCTSSSTTSASAPSSASAQTASAGGEKNASLQSGATTTRTTHAGVLEFVADEGTVGLPRKVVLSLLGATAHQIPVGPGESSGDREKASPAVDGLENVVVRYVRLAKATFARVVPETVGLSQVSELRAMLENNMRNHATLTVGDRLSVWRRGKEFSMKVRGEGVVVWMTANAFSPGRFCASLSRFSPRVIFLSPFLLLSDMTEAVAGVFFICMAFYSTCFVALSYLFVVLSVPRDLPELRHRLSRPIPGNCLLHLCAPTALRYAVNTCCEFLFCPI